MRMVRLLGVALAGTCLLGSLVLAQEGEQAERRPRERRQRRERRGPRRTHRELYERLLKELKLSEEQELRIKEILDTHRQAEGNLWKQQGDPGSFRDQWIKAREKNDEEALQALRDRMRKVARERQELLSGTNRRILEVLRGEQKERFVVMLLRGRGMLRSQAERIRLVLELFELPKAKRELANKILQHAQAAAAKVRGRREQARSWREAVEQIKTKVLNPDQAKKFDQLVRSSRPDPYAGLELSAEQKEQIAKIRAEAREKAKDAEPDKRREIWRDAMEKIRDEVLTEEQRDLQRKRHQERMRRGRGRRAGRPRRERTEPSDD